VLPAALAAPIAKRLSMFVLRAKVSVTDASVLYRVLGIGGPAAAQSAEAAFGVTPDFDRMALCDEVRMLRLPDGRILVLAPSEIADNVFERVGRFATPVGAPVWAWLAVQSGVPMITSATQDLFVAQAANFDALGAVDFRKGCYTGQEIVARMQYLGRLKERLFAFRTEATAPSPGTRLFGSAFGDQPSGTVLNSAPDPGGGSRFLAVAQIEAANAGTMTIGAVDGPVARREALPYAVPEPQPPRGRVQL
jgi:folate-binding protein YgfZ